MQPESTARMEGKRERIREGEGMLDRMVSTVCSRNQHCKVCHEIGREKATGERESGGRG